MRARILAAAVATFFFSESASAQSLMVSCSTGGRDGKWISPLFTVADDNLGSKGTGQHADDFREYGEKFKQVAVVAGWGGDNLPDQFYKYVTEVLKYNSGDCVASTDRALMIEGYARWTSNNSRTEKLRTWRPTGRFVYKVEEWNGRTFIPAP